MINELKTVAIDLPKQTGASSGTQKMYHDEGYCDLFEFKKLLDNEVTDVIVIAHTVGSNGDKYTGYYRLADIVETTDGNNIYCFSLYGRTASASMNRKKNLQFFLDDARPYVSITSYSS